jgi:hypothetical protein
MAEEGRGMGIDAAEAQRWYRLAEERGNAPARNHLALLFARGKGVTRDDGAALSGFRAAAAQGLAPARHNLGYMIANGLGTGARPDAAAGVALQNLAREVGPASPEDLPALDPSTLSPPDRSRSQQLLANFRNSSNLLASLDAALTPGLAPSRAAAVGPATTGANRSNGTDAGSPAPPSATQR